MDFVLVRVLGVLTLSVCGLGGSFLRDPKNVRNREHIKEHMTEYYEEENLKSIDEELKSDDDLQFHYFKLHDYDNNDKLDGLELYSAFRHFNEHSHEDSNEDSPLMGSSEEEVIAVVDMVLEMDDRNNDGFVDYFEFTKALEEARKLEANEV